VDFFVIFVDFFVIFVDFFNICGFFSLIITYSSSMLILLALGWRPIGGCQASALHPKSVLFVPAFFVFRNIAGELPWRVWAV
jgi:hypothetical protein